jgi:ribonuclease P protein component
MEPKQRCTFPRKLRVVRRGDFQRAYERGARARGAVMIVVAVANELPHARVGLSVGKSIWRGAVQRNRVRRVFREAFRLEQHALPAGFDLVLIPARPKLEPELGATRAELIALAHKAATKWRRKRGAAAEPRP